MSGTRSPAALRVGVEAADGTAAAADLGPRATRTRDRILAASRELFLKHGYAGTRIGQITAECGISRAGFYTYFRDKQEIFNALRGRVPRGAERDRGLGRPARPGG